MKNTRIERKNSKKIRLVIDNKSTQWFEDDEDGIIELKMIAFDHGFRIEENDTLVEFPVIWKPKNCHSVSCNCVAVQ